MRIVEGKELDTANSCAIKSDEEEEELDQTQVN